MATKTFLTRADFASALSLLKAPKRPPNGDEVAGFGCQAQDFSSWLSERLFARLSVHPYWLEAEPILLGSWARGELSPKSDIDLLFVGPEEKVRVLVGDFAGQGLKLRSRVPLDDQDWTKGVEAFDVLALFSARALSAEAAIRLKAQLAQISYRKFRQSALVAMRKERRARSERYDSISNFLEPNLKYGHGGLRDLEQAWIAQNQLFPERMAGSQHATQVFEYYKSFFLLTRQRLHLSEGAAEVLAAPEQRSIAEWFGFSEPRSFMREIQKGLMRVSFYADWVIETAHSSKRRLLEVHNTKLTSVGHLFMALEEDPSLLMQNRVRLEMDQVFARSKSSGARKTSERALGRRLNRILNPASSEAAMTAFFRSRLIDHCVPDFKKIVGYVQHDQYHRYSVDAHLLQVLRELNRLYHHRSRAGRLQTVVQELTKTDWQILAWASLYHDLAKGRGGNHAVQGIDLARRDLERFQLSEAVIAEVCWLVREHLVLSVAAFRENPRSPRTWQALFDKGVRGSRINRLAVFTVVDILGTNPEAWTPWKERLLAELTLQLKRPETDSVLGFAQSLKIKKVRGWERYLETFDAFLVSSLPAKVLVDDVARVLELRRQSSEIFVFKKGEQTWVRFHAHEDRAGLFQGYVARLTLAGLGVRHASIHTDEKLGVYDWFEVKTAKSVKQIQVMLESHDPGVLSRLTEKRSKVVFDSIEEVVCDDVEWVISFRGKDQSGALYEAARALFELGAEIRWAKVHTWGRQIDDVFGLARPSSVATNVDLIAELKRRLLALAKN